MPREHEDGAWSYRGFSVRYHRLADVGNVTTPPHAPWSADVLDTPEIPPLIGATYATVQRAAEDAIDDLLAQGHPTPPARSPFYRDYRRLVDYLVALPSTAQEIVLSFAEIEALLGGPLPITAQTHRQYWRSLTDARVRRWVALGWEARLHAEERVVVFTRTAAKTDM